MLNDYGTEVVSLADLFRSEPIRFYSQSPRVYGPPIGAILARYLDGAISASILYFPPGRYVLEGPAGRRYVVPKGIQLFFAADAILRVEDGVTLVVQGTIRAGNQQIFGFSRSETELTGVEGGVVYTVPTSVTTWPLYDGAGQVVIESDDMPLVRPEWWGASTFDAGYELGNAGTTARVRAVDSSDAFQGAIAAACTGRVGRAALPIVVSGAYQFVRAVEVRAPVGADGKPVAVCLVIRGGTGAGGGLASLFRFRSPIVEPLVTEAAAGLGSSDALARTDREATRLGGGVLLRLHPGVEFDLQNLILESGYEVPGCVEILCDADERGQRRGLLRRVTVRGGTESQLRVKQSTVERAVKRRQFVFDTGALTSLPGILSRSALRLDAGPGVLLHVTDTAMATGNLPLTASVPQQLPANASYHATCHLAGGSVLLDSLLFHQSTGPRPSRATTELSDLDQPDGQDVFLGAPPEGGRWGTHLTMVQCESQSWWLLSRDSRLARGRNVVLLGVSHGNVNWAFKEGKGRLWYSTIGDQSSPNAVRWQVWTGRSRHEGYMHTELPESPPSIVWRHGGDESDRGRCVLVGCRLGSVVVTDAPSSIVDVGTVFLAQEPNPSLYLRPEARPTRPSYQYTESRMGSLDAAVPHLVPILEEQASRP